MATRELSSVTASAPGSVTSLFVHRILHSSQDGSFEVSFVVEDGVDATVEPSADMMASLDEKPTTFESVENVFSSSMSQQRCR
jgi:pantoate kinase